MAKPKTVIGVVRVKATADFPAREFEVVEIVSDSKGHQFYVTNQIGRRAGPFASALVIPETLVESYTPR